MALRPRVAIIVAVWEGTPVAQSFLRLAPLISRALGEPCERVAVFNGPSPAAREPENYGLHRYALLSNNAGVARAWNIGWQLSLAKVVCFLNEDVVAEPGSLAPLLRALDDHADLAAVGPQGALWDSADMTHSGFVEPSAEHPVVACDAVSGFAFAVRREALREAGGFDERFSPAGGEEIDLGFSLRSAGWSVAAVHCDGLAHNWGISASSRRAYVEWLGGRESLIDIDARNRALLRAKWSGEVSTTRPRAILAAPRRAPAFRLGSRLRWLSGSVLWRLRSRRLLKARRHDS